MTLSSVSEESAPIHALHAGNSTLEFSADGRMVFSRGPHRWSSNGALAVLHYYDRQHPRAQVVAVPSSDDYAYGTAGTTSMSCKGLLSAVEAGGALLEVTLRFEAIHLSIPMHFELLPGGEGLTVTIPDEGIREENPRLYRLLGLEVLPEFGAARTGETGYLLLPNWFGCQCFFNKDYPREVRQTIYSSNDQWEHVCNMPLFGITRAQGTLCGLITKGENDAQLVCRQHWESHHANSVHPHLVYRWEQQDERLTGTRQIQYTFAGPDTVDGEGYVFCGKTYRRHLRQHGLLSWAEKARARPEALDYAGRFFLKIFMAYKDPQPDGQGTYHAGCTFDEARQIIEQCLARGMTHLTVVIVGWGQDGHDGKCPTYLPPDARLGGEDGMRRLVEWCRAHDIQLGVHTSHDGAYSCSAEFNPADLVMHRTGERWESIVWSGGQAHRLCPAVYLEKHVKRDLPRLAALGFHGHHHYDAVGSFMLCHAPEHPVNTRSAYIALIRRQFETALQIMGSVSTEMPFGPYYDLTDGFFHSYIHPYSWHLASSVGRYFYDRTVPLLPVVLHGSCNCGQAMEEGLAWRLEMLDLGTTPQTEVSMRDCPSFGVPAFAKKAGLIADTYRFFHGPDGVLARVGQAAIERRVELAEGVAETHYDNGMIVRVNRTPQPFGALPAMSFSIGSGENIA